VHFRSNDATYDATYAATNDATDDATDDATKWYSFSCNFVDLEKKISQKNRYY
jgi:hypothetical protein